MYVTGNCRQVAQHAAAVVGSCVFLFGGVLEGQRTNFMAVLNSSTQHFHYLQCGGSLPDPRCGHSLSTVGNRLYLFGGELKENILSNDVYVFESGTHKAASLDEPRQYLDCAEMKQV